MTTDSARWQHEGRVVLSLEPANGGPPGTLVEAGGRVWLVTDEGRRPVADADVATLLARHADALVPDAPIERARSERLGGKALADLLVAGLGAEAFGEHAEPLVNGGVFAAFGHPEASLWPLDPDDDPDVEVVLEAYWDLLRDDPSPTSGNPGVLTLLRHGEDYLVLDHGAEVAEVTRAGDPLAALGEHAELAVFAQTLRIDSAWLLREGEPAVLRLLDRSPPWSPARAIVVNGCLWVRDAEGWGRALAAAERATRRLPDVTTITAVDFGTWDPHSPLRQARAVPTSEPPPPVARPASSLDFVVLPPGASTDLAETTLEAALKSGLANETHRALVARIALADGTVRYGVDVASAAAELCQALGLPGWLALSTDFRGHHALQWHRADRVPGRAVPAAIVEGERPLTPFDLYDA
ncbi:MAG: hypothetical protein R6T85_00835 [Egibacteraceae bacterium]